MCIFLDFLIKDGNLKNYTNVQELHRNSAHIPLGGKSTLAHLFEFFDKKWKLEKLYESKGIKPKQEWNGFVSVRVLNVLARK